MLFSTFSFEKHTNFKLIKTQLTFIDIRMIAFETHMRDVPQAEYVGDKLLAASTSSDENNSKTCTTMSSFILEL